MGTAIHSTINNTNHFCSSVCNIDSVSLKVYVLFLFNEASIIFRPTPHYVCVNIFSGK